jgi:hypothetical protein
MSAEGARLDLSRISQAKGQRQTKSLPPHFFRLLIFFFPESPSASVALFFTKRKKKRKKKKWKSFRNSY